MKKILFYSALFLISLFLVNCSDDITKIKQITEKVRVEYSRCTTCNNCVEDFDCPANAIILDTLRYKYYIDADKCISCKQCIVEFNCPNVAFTTLEDNTKPGDITDFTAESTEPGKLHISFTNPGDDLFEGTPYRWDFTLKVNNQIVDYDPGIPFIKGGYPINWVINNLEENGLAEIELTVYDEMDNHNTKINREVNIQGIIPDEIPPSTIEDLSAEVSEDSAILTWTAPGDDGKKGTVISYDLRFSTEEVTNSNWENCEQIELGFTPGSQGTEESFNLNNLELQTDYYFAIKSTDDSGNVSEISNQVNINLTGDITAPADINDLVVVSVSTNSVSINWTAVGDNENEGSASYYVIKKSTSEINESNWDSCDTIDNNITPAEAGLTEAFIVENLESSTEYFIAIKTFDDNNNSNLMSNVINFTTEEIADVTPPAQITDLTATPSETSVILSWTAPGDDGNEGIASLYDIRIHTENITDENWESTTQLTNIPAPLEAGTEQSIELADLEGNVDYYFAIKTSDESQNISDMSNVVHAILEMDSTPPAQIQDLYVVEGSASNGTIQIRFSATGDNGTEGQADHYIIKYGYSQISEANWNNVMTFDNNIQPGDSGDLESVNITGLSSGQIYYFAVVAVDENGNEGDISNSPGGKIVYQINTGPCNGCGICVYNCPEDAITDHGSYATIDPDECTACGSCFCPRGAISLQTVGYNQPRSLQKKVTSR